MLNSTNNTSEQRSLSAAKIVILICYSTLLCSLCFNLLLIWTCLTIKRLRTRHNALVINLAFADLLLIGYIMPCGMAALVLGYNPFPPPVCVMNGLLTFLCFTSSFQSSMFIALNRYIRICKSYFYSRLFSSKNTATIMVATWILGAILGSSHLFYENGITYDKAIQMCIVNRYLNEVFILVGMTLVIGVPLIITCACYIAIYRHFCIVRGKINLVRNNGTVNARITRNIAVARSCFVVFITTIIAVFPYSFISTVLRALDLPSTVHIFAIIPCFANSAANSIIYGFMNKDIRESYKVKLRCFLRSNTVSVDDTDSTPNPLSELGENIHVRTIRVIPINNDISTNRC